MFAVAIIALIVGVALGVVGLTAGSGVVVIVGLLLLALGSASLGRAVR